jgi:hypothetical protein
MEILKNKIGTTFQVGEFYMLPNARFDSEDNDGIYYDSVLFLEDVIYEFKTDVVLVFKVVLCPSNTEFVIGEKRDIREGNNYEKLVKLENYEP